MPRFGIFHRFLEFVWNPGIILFDNELGHRGPFHWRQRFNLLDDFLCAHAYCHYTQNGWVSKGVLAYCRNSISDRLMTIVPLCKAAW